MAWLVHFCFFLLLNSPVSFLAQVATDPCTSPGVFLSGSSGFVSSPNFPNNFPKNSNCTWNIAVPSGLIIKVTFISFTLEPFQNSDCSGGAQGARVLITNVASDDGATEFKLCGRDKLPDPVYSLGNSIQMTLLSTDNQYPGFNASYLAIQKETLILRQQPNIQQSAPEYQLRKALFTAYDKMVRPVLKPSDVVNVTFDVEFKGLSEVNNKDQVITTDSVITQKWNNPYLQWNPVNYGGIEQILVDPKEVWVPDIVLQNNADHQVIQAGHLEKFRSWVLLRNNRENKWLSPATFKSSCTLDVQYFPFDKQGCSMVFRSLTSDRFLLDIYTKHIESVHPEEELKLTTSNGYWSLRSIEIKTKEYQSGRGFREVVVSFFIGRRPMHFVVFSIVPCMIIGMLVLVSFFIPAESGERIGLCATILLAVSVYLLVVTEQLPEQSETLPLIGVYYIVIMFEIGLALSATVLVLMAHHATTEPPRYLACITVLNRIGCCKKKKRMDIVIGSHATSRVGPEHAGMTQEITGSVELGEVEKQTSTDSSNRKRSSTAINIIQAEREEEEIYQETWKEIARALDRIFFSIFLAMFVISSIVIYAQAGRLASFDSFQSSFE